MGSLAAVISFLIFAKWFTSDYSWSVSDFFFDVFLKNNVMKIGTISILGQMLVFYLFYQKKMMQACKGIMITILAAILFMVIRTI